MKYIPYMQFGVVLFNDSFEIVKEKLNRYKNLEVSIKEELEKQYPCIFLNDEDLYIVFNQSGKGIRYIETSRDIVIEGCNLSKSSLSKIKKHFLKFDDALCSDEEGNIESKKYGFIISNEFKKSKNNLLFFSESYINEKEISSDDIINFFLGK